MGGPFLRDGNTHTHTHTHTRGRLESQSITPFSLYPASSHTHTHTHTHAVTHTRANFFNITFCRPPDFGPQKNLYMPHFLGKKAENHINSFGGFEGQKGWAIFGHKKFSLVCCSFPFFAHAENTMDSCSEMHFWEARLAFMQRRREATSCPYEGAKPQANTGQTSITHVGKLEQAVALARNSWDQVGSSQVSLFQTCLFAIFTVCALLHPLRSFAFFCGFAFVVVVQYSFAPICALLSPTSEKLPGKLRRSGKSLPNLPGARMLFLPEFVEFWETKKRSRKIGPEFGNAPGFSPRRPPRPS